MKISKKENKRLLFGTKIVMVLSIALLVFSFFAIIQNIYEGKPFYNRSAVVGLLVGSMLLVTGYLNKKRITAELSGKTTADERSKLVGYKSGLFAYLLLIAALMVSGIVNSAFNLGLEYTMAVNVIMVASIFSWLIIGYCIDKKGDA